MQADHGTVLLDTSAIIDFDAEAFAARAQTFVVSTISLAELAFGLHGRDPFVNETRLRQHSWVETTFESLPFSAAAARTYGNLCAVVRAIGRDPRPRRFDLLIAAVAVSEAIPLMTRNAADFRGLHDVLTVVDLGEASEPKP